VANWSAYWEENSRKANPHAQVGRTLRGEPVTRQQFEAIVADIEDSLDVQSGDRLLDLCCGNGMITERLARRCASVVAVDMIPNFVRDARFRNHSITTLCRDIRQGIPLPAGYFDKALLYFSLQYFTQAETVRLLDDIRALLKSGGVALLGDIPDATRIWEFFNSTECRAAYFDGLQRDEPIIGTWFDPSWLTAAAAHCGLAADIRLQPDRLPNSHYRFDLRATRCS